MISPKFFKVQEESDGRLLHLEEKRLEFEEQQLEKEAQQRKEEREFQLRMMQLMMGQGGYGSHYHPPGPLRGMQDLVAGDPDSIYTFPNADNN